MKGHFRLVHRLFDRLLLRDFDPDQAEFLLDMISGGEFGLAQRLLEKYSAVVQPQYASYPPIYAAARMGNLNLLRSMIEKYGSAWRYRKWPYDIAAERGHIDILHFLHTIPDGDTLQSTRQRANEPSLLKSTLFYAVRGGHLDVVRLLVEERHHPLTSCVAESRWHPSLITLAIAKQHWPIVEYLQSKGLKLQPKRVALEYAARKGNLALANYIINHLQHLRDPQKRWMEFRNALRFAAQQAETQQSDKMFMLLLDRSGLHFDPITNPLQDKKMLMKAADGNSVTILQKLWDLGCRNIDDPRILSYIFHYDARDGTGVVEWLLEHGANPCVTRRYERVPTNILNYAIESEMPDVAVKLVYAINKRLQTHPASEQPQQHSSTKPGKMELRITQLNQGEEGTTPFQLAIRAGYTSVVEAFLANGIDIQLYPRYLFLVHFEEFLNSPPTKKLLFFI